MGRLGRRAPGRVPAPRPVRCSAGGAGRRRRDGRPRSSAGPRDRSLAPRPVAAAAGAVPWLPSCVARWGACPAVLPGVAGAPAGAAAGPASLVPLCPPALSSWSPRLRTHRGRRSPAACSTGAQTPQESVVLAARREQPTSHTMRAGGRHGVRKGDTAVSGSCPCQAGPVFEGGCRSIRHPLTAGGDGLRAEPPVPGRTCPAAWPFCTQGCSLPSPAAGLRARLAGQMTADAGSWPLWRRAGLAAGPFPALRLWSSPAAQLSEGLSIFLGSSPTCWLPQKSCPLL